MNIGRYQLGTTVSIRLQCLDSDGSPAMPDAVPVIKIWNSSGNLVINAEMPIEDKRIQLGLFRSQIFLDGNFSAGNYSGNTFYVNGSLSVLTPFWFDVIAGGNQAGQALAMAFYHRPHADFIVYQTESGQIRFGANPRVQ